jgi:hypothetical protein
MPVGAIIGGAAAIGGSILGASSTKKAAKTAANAQTEASQQQLALGRETNALNREIYDQNRAILNPFVQRGNVAGDQINALLGLPSQPAPQAAQPQAQPAPMQPGPMQAAVPQQQLSAPERFRMFRSGMAPNQMATWANKVDNTLNLAEGAHGVLPAPVAAQQVAQPAPMQSAIPQQPAVNPMSAMENFANSAGMQFQLKQGTNALQNSAAARGMLQSGATLKGLQDYGQQMALNNYFMPYMGLLGGQQATGAGAASSVAGVGQNFVNTAANVMGHQSGAIQSGANALSNSAIARGVANSNMWSGIGGALGGIASSFR